MKLRNKIILIALIFVSMIAINCTNVFAEYVIKVDGGTAWTNINVSDAYDACQNLNTTYSTLGTTSLKAHLTTNADWYAVSLLTYSAYGTKNMGNTTGNASGLVFPVAGWDKYSFTASLQKGYNTNNTYISSLIAAVESGSPFVELLEKERQDNQPGRGILSEEGITGPLGYSVSSNSPTVIRLGLFTGAMHSGVPEGGRTFRPAIWNK